MPPVSAVSEPEKKAETSNKPKIAPSVIPKPNVMTLRTHA